MKNKQKGEISKVILILAGAVLLLAIIIFVAISITSSRKSDDQTKNQDDQTQTEVPKPVYDTTVGDIKFILQSSINMGNTMQSTVSFQPDLTTTERFIKVTMGAQNKGKNDTAFGAFELGNIIDSEGRNYIPITNKAFNFLPKPDLCGSIMKPEFAPISCVRFYEVSRKSEGLKIQVISKSPKAQMQLMDLDL